MLTILSEKGDLSKEELQERYAEGSMVGQIVARGNTDDSIVFKDAFEGPLCYRIIQQGGWDLSDQVIYIPAEDSNGNSIPIDRALQENEIPAVIEECFTGEDFLSKASGNIRLAEELFNFVSFQSPKLDFIFEYLDENEFEKNSESH